MARCSEAGHGLVRFLADTCDTDPMQLMSKTTGIVTGIPGRVGTLMQYFAVEAAAVDGMAMNGGSIAGGWMSDGTTHDGMRRFSEHSTGHSEEKDGIVTPHASCLDRSCLRTENRKVLLGRCRMYPLWKEPFMAMVTLLPWPRKLGTVDSASHGGREGFVGSSLMWRRLELSAGVVVPSSLRTR